MRNCHLGGSVPEDPNLHPCRPTLAENPYLAAHPAPVPSAHWVIRRPPPVKTKLGYLRYLVI